MIVTDSAYPKFYGFHYCSVYVVLAPGAHPLFVQFFEQEGEQKIWSEGFSWSHGTEASAAATWRQDQPSAEFLRGYNKWRKDRQPRDVFTERPGHVAYR